MLNCLIVEDDYAFGMETKIKVEEAGVSVIGIVSTFAEINTILKNEKVDIILSDVQLQNGEYAFDYFKTIKKLPPIIFFSGIKDMNFYNKSKESNPYIYLSKPFDDITLKSAIEGALRSKRAEKAEMGDIQKKNESLFVRSQGQMINLKPADIYFIQSEGNYIYIYTKNRKIVIRSSIKTVLKNIDSKNFIQIHRGYAINIKEIAEFNISENYVQIDIHRIPVGRKYKKSFRDLLRS